MPLFRRTPKPPRPISVELPSGEEVERAVSAELLYGKTAMRGALFMTNRRLMFEAQRGDARWMIVPYEEVKAAGLYPAPNLHLGAPASRRQCLCVETTNGEHVWWDFGEKDEREWLPLVQAKVEAVRGRDTPGDNYGERPR
jgi:hypothetical protein